MWTCEFVSTCQFSWKFRPVGNACMLYNFAGKYLFTTLMSNQAWKKHRSRFINRRGCFDVDWRGCFVHTCIFIAVYDFVQYWHRTQPPTTIKKLSLIQSFTNKRNKFIRLYEKIFDIKDIDTSCPTSWLSIDFEITEDLCCNKNGCLIGKVTHT